MSEQGMDQQNTDFAFIGPELSRHLEAGVASIIAEFYGPDPAPTASEPDFEHADEHTRALLDELERLWSRPV